MNVTTRQTVVLKLKFSIEFEALLLNSGLPHNSLREDLEMAARLGLEVLDELEDVEEIKYKNQLQEMIEKTRPYNKMTSQYFNHWKLEITEDLIDEIELMLLTHGEDLKQLGLQADVSTSLLLLAVTGVKM